MSKMAILVPNEELIEVAIEACERVGKQIPIEKVEYDEAEKAARKYEDAGAEIIISRGTVAMKIIESTINMPIVHIPITGYDLLRTIMEARKYGNKIGIADTLDILQDITTIETILGITVEKYEVKSIAEVEQGVQTLIDRGIDVLIGKKIYISQVQDERVKTIFLSSGVESVVQAIKEARSLIEVRQVELSRTKQLQAILDFIGDGVIAVDEKGIVTVCNPPISKILKIAKEDIIGKPIDALFENPQFDDVIKAGKEKLNQIQDEKGIKLISNQIPIKHNEHVFGAVYTFQELQKLQRQEQEIRKKLLHRGHVTKYHLGNIVGESRLYRHAIEKTKKYSQVDSTVLLTGETGVGKEVFAHLLHTYSRRADGPFVAVNCAAIPENLLESELFGYVDGAFTGARKGGKSGLFELAHRGTIFLDEIGELAESLQAQLLRVLQEGEVMRLGDERVIPIDVRVVAASNRNLDEMVDEKEFRADLYYRLNILDIIVPPLRDRIDDIPLLCHFFIKELQSSVQREITAFTEEAMNILQSYHWPGNIRQLRNIVERAMILSPSDCIDVETILVAGGKDFVSLGVNEKSEGLKRIEAGNLEQREREYILNVLKQVNGNKTEAAKILGIGRTTLWRKINSFDS